MTTCTDVAHRVRDCYTMAMPSVVILAGPNGAGKSTVAERVIRDLLADRRFRDQTQPDLGR